MKLEGRSAVITGASQGLGKAIGAEFVKEGANVFLCARGEALLKQTADELRGAAAKGQRVLYQACDVSKESEVEGLFSQATEEFGSLGILINNAGVYGPKGKSEEISFTEWARAVEINIYGTFLPCRLAVRLMKPKSYGKIVNISGGGATAPLPRLSAYAASKAAVVRLTETLAEELREFRIDVNAVAPGALNTRLLQEVLEAGPVAVGQAFYDKALRQRESGGVPLDKGARLCVYLASGESDGITGKLISAQWDPWDRLHQWKDRMSESDVFTLRRIVPEDRDLTF
jgi:NAD(P)-dependent dehydrogenase (short-subunit alcohol dehydrogenase family)